MHFTGQIYRPPTEAETPMLEVTSGCSHNKCAFCDMYRNSPFCVAPLWQVEQDLQELAQSGQVQDRIYLTGGDPFILSADKLLALAKLIRQYLPQVQTLTCYCSIRDLMGKTDEELRALRAAGYNHLFVGLETGYPPAVEMINKGHTLEEAHLHLERILDAGFDYAALLMGGIAGRGKGIENARATAALLNAHKPCEVSWISTSVNPGTELERLRETGEYVSPTERELLEEEIAFLEALDMEDDCWFFGTHPQNAVAVEGFFRDKAEMIAAIRTELAEIGDDILDSVLKRGSM